MHIISIKKPQSRILFCFGVLFSLNLSLNAQKLNNIKKVKHLIGFGTFASRQTIAEDDKENFINSDFLYAKMDYALKFNRFYILRFGGVYSWHNELLIPKKHMFNLDITNEFILMDRIHLDLGFYHGSLTLTRDKKYNKTLSQYLSLGGGVNVALRDKWIFNLIIRRNINITIKENNFEDYNLLFLGAQYYLFNKNNHNLRKKWKEK